LAILLHRRMVVGAVPGGQPVRKANGLSARRVGGAGATGRAFDHGVDVGADQAAPRPDLGVVGRMPGLDEEGPVAVRLVVALDLGRPHGMARRGPKVCCRAPHRLATGEPIA
jgi:hypothetical protein